MFVENSCVSVEVDERLQTMLMSVIRPNSTSNKIPTDIIVVDIPIDRKNQCTASESKEEESDDLVERLDDRKTYKNLMSTLNAFLEEANESTHSGKECISKQEIKVWWEKRFKLDERLKGYLKDIESEILGIFRCLLVPRFRNKQSNKLVDTLCSALVPAINDYLKRKTKGEYEATCYIKDHRRSPKMCLFRQLLQLIIIGLHTKEHSVGDKEMTAALRYILGVNGEYILKKCMDTVKQQTVAGHSKYGSKLNLKEFEPLILCIGDSLNHLPWESVPVLAHCLPAICRIPCLEFAALRVMEFGKYSNAKRLQLDQYHIINPKGDLKKTESRFARLLDEDWDGIKGQIPTADQFRDGLEQNDVFLYVGHNGGEEFMKCTKLETLSVKAVVFLMGCSSGLLKKKGRYQSNGIANYYMTASCPIMVANLWDVTDKDIDHFSSNMLRKCVLKRNAMIDIPRAVAASRSVCKLKYLNGAAPICYGIPFHLIHGVYA